MHEELALTWEDFRKFDFGVVDDYLNRAFENKMFGTERLEQRRKAEGMAYNYLASAHVALRKKLTDDFWENPGCKWAIALYTLHSIMEHRLNTSTDIKKTELENLLRAKGNVRRTYNRIVDKYKKEKEEYFFMQPPAF